MNRKALALMALGTLAAPEAMAQASTVTLYGRLFPQFNVLDSRGATPAGTPVSTLAARATGENDPRHNEVDSNSSRFGFRGTEDLGGGLRAVWQVETRIRLDTGGGGWADRDSHVGLSGGFGTVILGIWRTPYRYLAGAEPFMGISQSSIVSPTNIFATPGLRGDSAAGFHRREPNSVQYWSPKLGGFSFRVAHSPDEAKTAARNRNLWSAAGIYEAGSISVAAGYERHNDFFGGSRSAGLTGGTRSKDTAGRVALVWSAGGTKISAALERLKYTESGAPANGFQMYERDAFGVYAQHRMGKVTVAAMANFADEGKCTRVAATCSTADLGARQFAVGGKYSFSRRTELFTYYTTLRNDASASYTMGDLISPGTDFRGLALGINHSF